MASSADVLRSFLDHPDRARGTLTLDQLRGFLFAVANAPEPVLPSDWIPAIFGDGTQTLANAGDAEALCRALMEEFNAVNGFSLLVGDTDDGALPPDTALLADPMANLADDAPIHAWCQGFREGHRWLVETWNAYLDDTEDDDSGTRAEMSKELGTLLMVLCFFSSRQIAEAFHSETGAKDMSKLAETMHGAFPRAIRDYVRLGRTFQLAMSDMQEAEWRGTSAIRQNDPCPCGSGRKYKKCCGVTH
jgi:uncharacterized protein